MHLGLVILSALPTTWAAHAYSVPPGLVLLEADETNSCVLPDAYHILNFKGQSKDGGKTLSAFDFNFEDEDTKVKTPCHKNSSSKVVPSPGSSRYACDNAAVEFLWDDDDQKLWVMEKVCDGSDGTAQWEAGGSAIISLKCGRSGSCTSNSTDHRALFTSLNPVRKTPPS
ncbi:hypothetical protein NCS52_00059300 [Fusarium sp. LHS14.1]|nr:hypothetical protein NCS52_00059300 [Fusarium sp. LHS14.1]